MLTIILSSNSVARTRYKQNNITYANEVLTKLSKCDNPISNVITESSRANVVLYQSQNHKGCENLPPCMLDELEDRKSYENHVIDLGKFRLSDVTSKS